MKDLRQTYKIRSYEVDFHGVVRPATLLNFLQDMAGEHAGKLGVSVTDLFRQNRTWVLSRSHLQIIHPVRWNDEIAGRTWPSGREGLFALRDFEILDRKGARLAVATSSWMVIDLKQKKPVRLDDDIMSIPLLEERALPDDFKSLPPIEKVENEVPFRVRISDLDINRHVNNVVFVEWALEAVPAEVLWNFQPVEIEVSYRAEAFYEDRIISRSQNQGDVRNPVFIHQLIREKDGKEISRLRTRWSNFRQGNY